MMSSLLATLATLAFLALIATPFVFPAVGAILALACLGLAALGFVVLLWWMFREIFSGFLG